MQLQSQRNWMHLRAFVLLKQAESKAPPCWSEVRYIDKIKEKPQVQHTLKERVKSAPKELIRRGLDDGTERLRGQLRDTAQHGQRDDLDVYKRQGVARLS